MKFDCGPTWQEKRAAKEKWHRWFAWRPIRVDDHDCRWLEFIERRITWEYGWGDVYVSKEYRALDE